MTSEKTDEKETIPETKRSTDHDEKIIEHSNIKYVTIDFGKCTAYREYVKKFPIENFQNTVGPRYHYVTFFNWTNL